MVTYVRHAIVEDHPALLAIAKQHKATRDFGHIMFSSPAAYAKNWIGVAERFDAEGNSCAVGFYCVRHKVRAPETSLYYLAVSEECRRQGIGEHLLDDMIQWSPETTTRIVLTCLKDNHPALAFYRRRYRAETTGEKLNGKAWQLTIALGSATG